MIAKHGGWAHAARRQGGIHTDQLHLKAAVPEAGATLIDPLRGCPASSAHNGLCASLPAELQVVHILLKPLPSSWLCKAVKGLRGGQQGLYLHVQSTVIFIRDVKCMLHATHFSGGPWADVARAVLLLAHMCDTVRLRAPASAAVAGATFPVHLVRCQCACAPLASDCLRRTVCHVPLTRLPGSAPGSAPAMPVVRGV